MVRVADSRKAFALSVVALVGLAVLQSRGKPLRRLGRHQPDDVKPFTASVPKAGESLTSNADRAFVGLRRAAVADGVSRSYDPRRWAQVLAETATISDIDGSPLEMAERLAASLNLPNPEEIPWNEAALREDGCRSTLLLAEWEPTDEGVAIEFRALGDCLAVIESGADGSFTTWPFTSLDEFPIAPDTLSTESPYVFGEVLSGSIALSGPGRLILMTDALGRYTLEKLSENPSLSEVLPFLANPEQGAFSDWVDEQRQLGHLEDDDTTVAVISRW